MLELGCGDGGNLLSLAQALPGARLVGIDVAASAVERGMRLARAAGLENVELRCMDLEELPEGGELGEAGSFDYILSHGVYSWIPPRARVALLAGARPGRALLRAHDLTNAAVNTPDPQCFRAFGRSIPAVIWS